MRVPCSTYRLQLTPDFGFEAAREAVPYLYELGVSDLYLSPILEARSGSRHGYDVTDPRRIRAELGGEEAFYALSDAVRGRGMGLLVDIVPNHMAASHENPWWWDVLEHGPASRFAEFFDIDWERPAGARGESGRLVLPFLGQDLAAAAGAGEIAVEYRPEGFVAEYFERVFPLDPGTYPALLANGGEAPPPLREVVSMLAALPPRKARGPADRDRRHEIARTGKDRLRDLYAEDMRVREVVHRALRALHAPAGSGEAARRLRLESLIEEQVWRLVDWQAGAEAINYRRFFSINDLIGVRVEDPDVFDLTHAAVRRLVREGIVTGLRIDHVDGLADPEGYLARLRNLRPDGPLYVVVEKILAEGEDLPETWPVAGTTGYDFLGQANRLFVEPTGLARIVRHWAAVTGVEREFAELARGKKREIAERQFRGEIESLAAALVPFARADPKGRDLTGSELANVVLEATASLPVYRTYARGRPLRPEDLRTIGSALDDARARAPDLPGRAFDLLASVLTLEAPGDPLAWVRRWQQVSGAVMAKGVEDTAFYLYNPLLSLNEVGGDPGAGAIEPVALHDWIARRGERWPGTQNATSTHDTKRSEDVRCRIAVLSEMAERWTAAADRWRAWNRELVRTVNGAPAPSPNRELALYQTLLGAWPLDPVQVDEFRERIAEHIPKTLREAKAHSSWRDPDEEYETAVIEFAARILDPSRDSPFLEDFLALEKEVALHGASRSLAQVVLKAAAPGVPDAYQGNELWEFRLVDPDNRRLVDFERRARLLAELPGHGAGGRASPSDVETVAELRDAWRDGRLKLHVEARSLRLRRARPALFRDGGYRPLEPTGRHAGRLLAFGREAAQERVVALLAIRTVGLAPPGETPLGGAWEDSGVRLPPGWPRRWRDVLSGAEVAAGSSAADARLLVAEVLQHLPVALLRPA